MIHELKIKAEQEEEAAVEDEQEEHEKQVPHRDAASEIKCCILEAFWFDDSFILARSPVAGHMRRNYPLPFFFFLFRSFFLYTFFFLLFVLNILHTTAAGFLFVAHNPAPFKSQFYSHMELNELYLFT